MSRFIDADKLIKYLRPSEHETPDERWMPESEFASLVNTQRTIDAVPVVRCKDCKYFQYGDYCVENKMEHGHCHEDDFCSYGEREEKKS